MKQTSFYPEMGQQCPAGAQIKYVLSPYRYAYLTVLDPAIELSGPGIEFRGLNRKGQRNYSVTEAALNKISAKHHTVYEALLD